MLKLQRNLVVLALLLAFVVVVLGAYTRLVDAGLGCPDWPTCYGHLWVPKTEAEVALANSRFADTPVEHHKTWPEQTHRIAASSLGLLFMMICALALQLRLKQKIATPLLHPLLMLGFIVLQGLFGMWTVTLLLWPQVVLAHLLGGFTTVSLLFLLLLRLWCPPWQLDDIQRYRKVLALRPLLLVLLVAVSLQIALGGWTAANYAAVACADFPRCHNQWWPEADFVEGFNFSQHVGPNYLGGQLDNHARTAIHLAHRIGALCVTVLALLVVFLGWRLQEKPLRSATVLLAAVLLVQLGLGVSNILFALPLAVAVAHNAVGALLLLTVIYLCFLVWTVQFKRRKLRDRR